MKKTILTVTLVAALAIMPTIGCMAAQNDSPNDKPRYKQTSIQETSVLVNDKLEPKCKCEKETCPKEEKMKKENQTKQQEEKIKKENEAKQQEEKKKKENEIKSKEDKTKSKEDKTKKENEEKSQDDKMKKQNCPR